MYTNENTQGCIMVLLVKNWKPHLTWIGENISDLGLGKDFLDIALKAKPIGIGLKAFMLNGFL